MRKIVVVDYGSGNLRSVSKALEAVAGSHCSVEVSSDPAAVKAAERIVLPGQGAMGDCMAHLRASGLEQAVRESLRSKPVFAVCIGMQMLFEESEENQATGLGIFRGKDGTACTRHGSIRFGKEFPTEPGSIWCTATLSPLKTCGLLSA